MSCSKSLALGISSDGEYVIAKTFDLLEIESAGCGCGPEFTWKEVVRIYLEIELEKENLEKSKTYLSLKTCNS